MIWNISEVSYRHLNAYILQNSTWYQKLIWVGQLPSSKKIPRKMNTTIVTSEKLY